MKIVYASALICIVAAAPGCATSGQRQGENVMLEVSELPAIKELPDVFRFMDGRKVETKADWQRRRAEIIAMLEHYEYGHMPPAPKLRVIEESATPVFDGKALDVRAVVAFDDKPLRVHMGLFIPQGAPGRKYPAVIETGAVWGEKMQEAARRMIDRGYIFAGYDRHEIDRDDADRSDGVHPLYPEYDWATLAAWAWGARRTLDYLLTRPEVDAAHVAVTGHSRGGKTALWAGALDERFALVAPHASGAGGAGCFRIMGPGAESLEIITSPKRFHYWFHPRLATFARQEERLPFDQHFLKALVAPRALLSVEGLADHWANPLGTQRTYQAAQPVFDFLGVPDKNAIFFREGGHDVTLDDWDALLDFADACFFGKTPARRFNALPFP
ncbi:MAG TPA: hypothetical protein PKO36_15355 [Candidatus Hydrogenedentes bacterium]|nr:hypothetical protein [Candidatus Hydrogenedentota bacterium]HOT50398.1 hypothetical protein [Candidatus Hydrogenedentota bacterium]HOV73876.1 hypothetical protein [Candidatus Hydrogenedentota bacterium]HPC14902.1 hypothetical protein [Candidatus Hydrogenedentota bacterium]HRT18766.1 hypothetical protein [Candidatus Hydrogenedentota bacterium]